MTNQYLRDIAYIYSILNKISYEESLHIVKCTDIGKSIIYQYPDILYDSILCNLYKIICETSSNNVCIFSDDEIVNAYNDYFKNMKQDLSITLGVDYKYKYKNWLKQQQKIFLYVNKNIIKNKNKEDY